MTEQERAKTIKKVLRQRRMLNVLLRLSKRGSSSGTEEILLETEVGTVRTLWYGFEDKTTKPVFFDMHGGGFILMNAEADDSLNKSILEKVDCKIISIDYSLAPEHPFPTAVNEVYAVVKEVHQNAELYGIDPNRMAIGGHSAGGNLAAVTCIQANRKKEFTFACQILDYPPLDLATSPYDKPFPKDAINPKDAALYDACYIEPSQATNPLVSPVYATAKDLEGSPPALVILVGHDSLHDEGLRYAQLLESVGVDVALHDFPDEKHGFTYYRTEAVPKAIALMTDFLNTHFEPVSARSQ